MKQTSELSSLQLTPLTAIETRQTSGGFVWIPVALGVSLLVSAINNFGDIRDGIVDGFNGTPRYPKN